jgi:hypothetical protein
MKRVVLILVLIALVFAVTIVAGGRSRDSSHSALADWLHARIGEAPPPSSADMEGSGPCAVSSRPPTLTVPGGQWCSYRVAPSRVPVRRLHLRGGRAQVQVENHGDVVNGDPMQLAAGAGAEHEHVDIFRDGANLSIHCLSVQPCTFS